MNDVDRIAIPGAQHSPGRQARAGHQPRPRPYTTPQTPPSAAPLEAVEDVVLDRLFVTRRHMTQKCRRIEVHDAE